jgi:hypothetical protein
MFIPILLEPIMQSKDCLCTNDGIVHYAKEGLCLHQSWYSLLHKWIIELSPIMVQSIIQITFHYINEGLCYTNFGIVC